MSVTPSRDWQRTIDDRGSAVVELPLVVVPFILLLWLGYGGIRLVTVQGDVQAAGMGGRPGGVGLVLGGGRDLRGERRCRRHVGVGRVATMRVGWRDHHRFLVAGRSGFGHGHLRGLVVRGDRGRVPRLPDLPVDGR